MVNVAEKKRTMHNAIVLDTSNVPSFPTGPDSDGKMVFAGDFRGATILGMSWVISGTFDITTADGKLQHSDDGTTWHDVDATNLKFTQLAASGTEFVGIDPELYQFKPFLRFALTAGGAGTTTNIALYIHYLQCGAKGNLAPPGMVDKLD